MPLTLNTKIYNGNGIANAIASYTERSGGAAASFSDVTSSLKIDSKVRGRVKLTLPEVVTEASSCACPGDVRTLGDVVVEFRIDKNASAAFRTDLSKRLKDLVNSADLTAMITDLKNMPGT